MRLYQGYGGVQSILCEDGNVRLFSLVVCKERKRDGINDQLPDGFSRITDLFFHSNFDYAS